MNLYTPGTNLIIWQLTLMIISAGLAVFAFVKLSKNDRLQKLKLLWAVVIICLPVVGPISYLVYDKGNR